jgi:hypothetical protein
MRDNRTQPLHNCKAIMRLGTLVLVQLLVNHQFERKPAQRGRMHFAAVLLDQGDLLWTKRTARALNEGMTRSDLNVLS